VKPLERIGEPERRVIDERRATGYSTAGIANVDTRLEPALRRLLERLLPGVGGDIDLVAFIDRYVGIPLGRGDRRAGYPPERELFAAGLAALTDAGFQDWSEEDQRALVSHMRRGEADGELGVPAKEFVDRVLDKALIGYLAHPDTWIRIGFTGPAYPEGYAWIGSAEAVARREKKFGWDRL
jgi:Gluconate 2-dehydrogenase subunit 3